MKFDISPLAENRADDVMSYLRLQYGEDTYCADPIYFRWLHIDSPCEWFRSLKEKGYIPVNALLNDEGGIVGVHTYVPFDVTTPWKGVRGAWDIDWVHTTNVRGNGRELAGRLISDVDVYVGYGSNVMSRKAFKKMGFKLVDNVPRIIGLIDIKALSNVLEQEGLHLMLRDMEELAYPNKGWYLMETLDEMDEMSFVYTALSDGVFPVRSKKWMQWRYVDHPYIKYTMVSTDRSCSSVAVIRLEPIKHNEHLFICRILDIYSKNSDVTGLLFAVLNYAKENGAVMLDYFTTNARQASELVQNAKGESLDLMLGRALPYKFQPIEYSSKDNSFNFIFSEGGKAPESAIIGEFFSTKADANQDVYIK